MSFTNRRPVEIFYDTTLGQLTENESSVGSPVLENPYFYTNEAIALKLHLLQLGSDADSYSKYRPTTDTSAIYTVTVNIPDSEKDPAAENPVIAYAYGQDGDHITEDYKGEIYTASDFPPSTTVTIGDRYKIMANVTDNGGSGHTDTEQSFTPQEYIVWLGNYWYVKLETSGLASGSASGASDEITEYIQGINVNYDWVGDRTEGTVDATTTTKINAEAHGLVVGDAILAQQSAASWPANAAFTADTKYWVVEKDTDWFKIATAPGGQDAMDLVSGGFYWYKSYANAYNGKFSIRLNTNDDSLKSGYSSSFAASLVFSVLHSNDEDYAGAPQYNITNLFEIPLTARKPPYLAATGSVEPPDLVLDYPTVATTLALLSSKIDKATGSGFESKIPIYDSNGNLIPSVQTLADVLTDPKLNEINNPDGATSIDLGGYNVTLQNPGTFKIDGYLTVKGITSTISGAGVDIPDIKVDNLEPSSGSYITATKMQLQSGAADNFHASNMFGVSVEATNITADTLEASSTVKTDTMEVRSGSYIDMPDIRPDEIQTPQVKTQDINGYLSGSSSISGFNLNSVRKLILYNTDDLTISSGTITVTQSAHSVNGEGDTADNLDTINGGTEGQLLVLTPGASDNDITLTTSGNIITQDGNNYEIPSYTLALLYYIDGSWRLLGGSGSGGSTDVKVKADNTDTVAGYLIDKLAAGVGLNLAQLSGASGRYYRMDHALNELTTIVSLDAAQHKVLCQTSGSTPSLITVSDFWNQAGYGNTSEIWVQGANGYGSSATKIRRFSNTLKNAGADVTYADSATAGGSFTVNSNGLYSITYADNGDNDIALGVTVNAQSGSAASGNYHLDEAVGDLADVNARKAYTVASGDNWKEQVSVTLALSAGDVVRPHTNGVTAAESSDVSFRITRLYMPFDISGSGYFRDGENLGTGAGVYKDRVGPNARFRSITGTNLTVTEGSDEINISLAAGYSSGSNLGTGLGVYKEKTAQELLFRSLKAGTDISLVSGADDITVNNTSPGASGSNIGVGYGVYSEKITDKLLFRSLEAGTDISITSGAESLTINNTSPGASGSNVGTGLGVYKEKISDELLFRTLKAAGNIQLISGADDITISGAAGSAGGLSWQVISTDTAAVKKNGYLTDVSSNTVKLTLPASPSEGDTIGVCDYTGSSETNSIRLDRNGELIHGLSEDLYINVNGAGFTIVFAGGSIGWRIVSEINAGSNGIAVTSGSNLGSGEGIYSSSPSYIAKFKSLVAGTDISLASTADEITINNTSPGNSGSNVGTGTGVYKDTTGDTLNFKSLVEGTDISISQTADEITITGTQPESSGSNLGTGAGVYKQTTGDQLAFRTIKQGANVTVTENSDEVEIAAAQGGAKSFWIDAADWGAGLQSGTGAYAGATNLTSNDVRQDFIDFPKNIYGNAQMKKVFPDNFSGSTFNGEIWWTAGDNSGSTGQSVRVGMGAFAVGQGDTLDRSFSSGSGQVTTDAFVGVGDGHLAAKINDISISNFTGYKNLVQFKTYREGNHGDDTYNGTMRMLGVYITYS